MKIPWESEVPKPQKACSRVGDVLIYTNVQVSKKTLFKQIVKMTLKQIQKPFGNPLRINPKKIMRQIIDKYHRKPSRKLSDLGSHSGASCLINSQSSASVWRPAFPNLWRGENPWNDSGLCCDPLVRFSQLCEWIQEAGSSKFQRSKSNISILSQQMAPTTP